MIQLSTLPALTPELPQKSAEVGASAGAFAALLADGAEAGLPESGKILPVGGKTLPAVLPVAGEDAETATRQAPENPAQAAVRPAIVQIMVAASVVRTRAVAHAPQPEQPADAAEVPKDDAEMPEVQVETLVLTIAESPELVAALPEVPHEQPMMALPLDFAPAAALTAAMDQAEAETKASTEGAPRHAPAYPATLVLGREAGRAEASAAQIVQIADAKGAAAVAVPSVEQSTSQDNERADTRQRSRGEHEVRFELASDGKKTAGTEPSAPRLQQMAQAISAAAPEAAIAQSGDTQSALPSAKAGFDALGQQNALRPHDLIVLVDRLVEARESARSATAGITLTHSDFGKVEVNFSHENGNLTVSLANNDPEFVRTVNAAVATDSQANGDATFQGGRREEGGQGSPSRMAADSQSAGGDRSNGRQGSERSARQDRMEARQGPAGAATRKALGGIFA